jgi:hypothetical protein
MSFSQLASAWQKGGKEVSPILMDEGFQQQRSFSRIGLRRSSVLPKKLDADSVRR